MIEKLQVLLHIRIENDKIHCYNPFKGDKTKYNSCHGSNLNCNQGYTNGCNAFGVNLRWDEEYGAYFRCEDCINEARL